MSRIVITGALGAGKTTHTFEHAESVDRITQDRCGYQVVEVPMGSVDERCRFVLDAQAHGDA
jgi:predicted ATPase